MTDDRTIAALHQIAHALGVSVSVLCSPEQSSSLTLSARRAPETAELLEAFDRILDPQVRRDCIEFARKAASS